ncbi:glutathione hydrolase 1 proenzyme-like [Anopheles marshallii]|uniref:glutathione hydrolase 1 proenzyme-like n=1 Tax=Anopheles marshallii TaxID=1521116 RepID=UPI00237A469B|nr:glutathione hydrolase 1 proenzyme-like [Anopheles marshallii]
MCMTCPMTRSQYTNNARAAVTSNAAECAEIGMNMLDQGGSAADAAIATLFCEGVSIPQSMGIGGGFVLTVYNKASGIVESLDSREVAPAAATKNMYVGNGKAAIEGGLSIAVPGEVKGYWELHQKYGKLPWKTLVNPTIDLCTKGSLVTDYLSKILSSEKSLILTYPALAKIFINPATNDTWKVGDRIKRLALGESLKVIAVEGANALYGKNGTLLPKLMKDLKTVGSILTENDFYNYKPEWLKSARAKLRNHYYLHSMPLPGSGPILSYMLSILDGYKDLSLNDPLTWHRIIESFKHGYGLRTKVGDPRFVTSVNTVLQKMTNKNYIAYIRDTIVSNMTFNSYDYYGADFAGLQDQGTAHISVLAANGDAIAVTSTINYLFGSLIVSPLTGIILNDEMDDFSTPGVVNSYGLSPSPANFIVPGKRPLSSMSPTIIIDRQGDVRMVVGGAGGSRITTATALLILRHLYFKQGLCDAMNAPRIHHQLAPMQVEYEKGWRSFLLVVCMTCPMTRSQDADNMGAAVASNAAECAEIGMNMLDQGGSAADAAIATLFCEGVSIPQSMGIGGGFVLTVYNKASGIVESLDSREVAPAAATKNMYVGNGKAAIEGGLSIAVPGEVKGYWELHQKYGKLSWKTLVNPTIDLCTKGSLVTDYLSKILSSEKSLILTYPALAKIFINPATNDTWKVGDRIKRLALGESLKVIAVEGANALYGKNGTLLPKLMKDLKTVGSILTENDFYNYKPEWLKSARAKLRNHYYLHSMPLPGSGPILSYMLSILDGYKDLSLNDPLTWHRIIESFKHGYGLRTKVGDPRFVTSVITVLQKMTNKNYIAYIRDTIVSNMTFNSYDYYGADFAGLQDQGTAHISVLAANGDAIAVTSTINYLFGSLIVSPLTGIILNDEMDDFSTPGVVNSYGLSPSPANIIVPGKRPLSSMSPTIIIDRQGDVRMVVGGAGGSRITTATALLILRHLYFKQGLCDAMNAPRIHHQLAPMQVEYEKGFDSNVVTELAARGHKIQETKADFGFAALTAIAKQGDTVSAAFDRRRGGSVSVRPHKTELDYCRNYTRY